MLFKWKLLYIIYLLVFQHFQPLSFTGQFDGVWTEGDHVITMSPATAVKVSPVQEQDRDKEAGQAARRPAKLQDLE